MARRATTDVVKIGQSVLEAVTSDCGESVRGPRGLRSPNRSILYQRYRTPTRPRHEPQVRTTPDNTKPAASPIRP